MITPLPSDAVRTAALRDALTDALRAGRESVLHYALLLIEQDLRLSPSLVTANEVGNNEAAKEASGPAQETSTRCPDDPFDPATTTPDEALSQAASLCPSDAQTGYEEVEMKARTYILARHRQGEYIDCAAICRLTGWDAPHIRRFIAATLDELHPTPTTRKRGRPRTIPTAGEKFRQ